MSSFASLFSKVLKGSTAIALTAFFALPSHAMDDDPFNRPNLSYKFVPYELKSTADIAEDGPNGKVTVLSNDNIIGSYLIESQAYRVVPNQSLSIEYDITVDGDIAFGFLNESRNNWFPILNSYDPLVKLSNGSHKNKKTMIVPEGATSTSLVFAHNKYDLGVSSTFKINSFKINGMEDPIFSSIYAKKAEFGLKKFVMTNDNIVGSYQLETTPFAVKGGQKITATFELGLLGKLAFGCLNQARTNWYEGLVAVEGDDVCETKKYLIDVTVPYGEEQASIVFVNNQPQQGVGSVFTLSDLKIGIGEQFNTLENKKQNVEDIQRRNLPVIAQNNQTLAFLDVEGQATLNQLQQLLRDSTQLQIDQQNATFRAQQALAAISQKSDTWLLEAQQHFNRVLAIMSNPALDHAQREAAIDEEDKKLEALKIAFWGK